MKDERIAIKGWPKKLRSRRSNKIGMWNDDWSRRREKETPFHPERRRHENSDYNEHYITMEASREANNEFSRRLYEIEGRNPIDGDILPDPDYGQRWRGALLDATIGDAFGRAVDAGTVRELPWSPDLKLDGDKALTEYVLTSPTTEPGAVTQLTTFTLDGLIRACAARRQGRAQGMPIPETQHAYQRWLHTQRGQWRDCGGPYAVHTTTPDGWLVHHPAMHTSADADQAVVAELERFARTGVYSTYSQPHATARGSEVLPRAAVAAITVPEAATVFTTAVNIAMLTHNHAEDYLAAGTLATLLHQQLQGHPFLDCLETAQTELRQWPGHEPVTQAIERALNTLKEHWVPAQRQIIASTLSSDATGAGALELALYCAMASDYLREALLMTANYATRRPVVAAITGLIIGADYGTEVIPPDLLSAVPFTETIIDPLAHDALREFSTDKPNTPDWFERYPPW